MTHPPVCDYEGSDYQASFWDRGGRQYEDRAEAIALRRLLPRSGRLMLELGAGAGRNTPRYVGFDRIVLVDYSRTQLEQAQARLGGSDKYIFVAADIYRLPFIDGLFDAATMIRTLHHMAEPRRALAQVRTCLSPGATFILEFANKLNVKAVLRYWLGRQSWSPFSLEPAEFARLNFDFHPVAVRQWLSALGFRIDRVLTVSHFRSALLKRTVPLPLLVGLDSILQWTGAVAQFSPSVFLRAKTEGLASASSPAGKLDLFKCPECSHTPLAGHPEYLECPHCGSRWLLSGGIYDFRQPLGRELNGPG